MKKLYFLFILFNLTVLAQTDISDYLKQIDEGNAKDVKPAFDLLYAKHPNDPNVLFLKGILQENADHARETYIDLINRFPQSDYADAAAFRLFQYYFALEDNANIKRYELMLKLDYPKSPYVKSLANYSKQTKTKTTTNNSTKTSEGAFKIQAGAFLNEANAVHLKDELIKDGLKVEINNKLIGGSNYYIVIAGNFTTKHEAEVKARQLDKEYSLNSKVITK